MELLDDPGRERASSARLADLRDFRQCDGRWRDCLDSVHYRECRQVEEDLEVVTKARGRWVFVLKSVKIAQGAAPDPYTGLDTGPGPFELQK